VKQETKRKNLIEIYSKKKQRRTSSENSSSEQSVDNDVVAAKVNYSRKQKLMLKRIFRFTLGG